MPHRCPSASRRPLGARVRPARATEGGEEEECSLPPPPAPAAPAPFPPPPLGHAGAPLWPWCDGPAPLLEAVPGPPQWLGLAPGLRSGAPSSPFGGRPEADARRALPAASSPGQSRSRSLSHGSGKQISAIFASVSSAPRKVLHAAASYAPLATSFSVFLVVQIQICLQRPGGTSTQHKAAGAHRSLPRSMRSISRCRRRSSRSGRLLRFISRTSSSSSIISSSMSLERLDPKPKRKQIATDEATSA